jgi:formyltetrahydrofolate synthetase
VTPDAAVLVATVGCLREHGGGSADAPSVTAVRSGCANLRRHLGILESFGVPTVVAINRFPDDTSDELAAVSAEAKGAGAVVTHDAFAEGGQGCLELAEATVDAAARSSACHPLVTRDAPVMVKIETIATRVYGAAGVELAPTAVAQLAWLEDHGFGQLPVCMAKTHRSLSHNPNLRGAPSGFTVPISALRLAAGAGYVTVLAGDIATMPGLPAHARFRDIDLDPDGGVTGLS